VIVLSARSEEMDRVLGLELGADDEEPLPFALAYGLASAAAVALLAHDASAMLGGWRRGAAFGGGLGLLYGALYVLLSHEQTALVLGDLLLFGVLATVMALTRRLDWYGLSR
jgi:inner membrane protein